MALLFLIVGLRIFAGLRAVCVGLNGKAENAKPLSFV